MTSNTAREKWGLELRPGGWDESEKDLRGNTQDMTIADVECGFPLGADDVVFLSTSKYGEDWASLGQPKGKAEMPVVTRESRRNSRKTTWFPPLGKMRPLPATASQGKTGISGFHSRLPRGVRPRLEGKQRTPLSSQVATRISWSPLSGLKGVKHPLQFGERTRDCSPGHAGKEGPQLARTGESQGFLELRRQYGVSHEI